MPRPRPSRPATPSATASARRPGRGGARRALLDAAHALVRRQGWAATSVDELCNAARVTKGAFFHHFESKQALGEAAARHWGEVTTPLFAAAPYHALPDPLERVFGYLDFRAQLARGPLEAITCFVGTVVQESFATSEAVRAACGAVIFDHAARLEPDLRAAMAIHPPRLPVDAASLAAYTQAVLQGSFVLAKARGDNTPVLEAIGHLRDHLALLFGRGPGSARRGARRPAVPINPSATQRRRKEAP